MCHTGLILSHHSIEQNRKIQTDWLGFQMEYNLFNFHFARLVHKDATWVVMLCVVVKISFSIFFICYQKISTKRRTSS